MAENLLISDFVLFFSDILGFYFNGVVESYGRKSLEVSVISDQRVFLEEVELNDRVFPHQIQLGAVTLLAGFRESKLFHLPACFADDDLGAGQQLQSADTVVGSRARPEPGIFIQQCAGCD